MNDDFYMGYLPKAPAGLGKIVARIAAGVLLAGLIAGGLLIFGQPPFATGKFEYGEYRDYAGVIEEWPYPMLVTDNARFLLVAPGKHGLSDTVKGLQGKHVQLKGSLIERTPDRMIEVVPASIAAGAQRSHSSMLARVGDPSRESHCHLATSRAAQTRRVDSSTRRFYAVSA